jgi:hypothetical protein
MDESEVERRAIGAVRTDSPHLREEYRRKFGNEIGADNAWEIVFPEYAAPNEERTRLSRAIAETRRSPGRRSV